MTLIALDFLRNGYAQAHDGSCVSRRQTKRPPPATVLLKIQHENNNVA